MSLFRTTFWNGIATVFKILTGIVTTKIVAIFLGPSGVAILGNFNNFVTMITSFSNGAISNGIIKYMAENNDNKDKQQEIISNSIKIGLLFSIVITILILVFNKKITIFTIKDIKYSYATIALGVSILFYSFNLTVSAILNGYRQMKYLVINSMITSTIMMILAIIITRVFGLFGALVNAMIAQIIIFVVNIYFVKKLKLINAGMIIDKLDKELTKKILKFSMMTIITAVLAPLSTFIIRNYIIVHFSSSEAGYIQGIWSISNSYLMIVTTTLSIYYLPTLSALKNENDLRKEIIRGYKFILPIAIFGAIAIFIFRDIIINLLYTSEFLAMREYFLFQNIGDMFKIASFLLAYLMLAKAMTKLYIISEIIFFVIRVNLSIGFVNKFGPIGETYSYALNYFLYLIFVLILFRKLIFNKSKY